MINKKLIFNQVSVTLLLFMEKIVTWKATIMWKQLSYCHTTEKCSSTNVALTYVVLYVFLFFVFLNETSFQSWTESELKHKSELHHSQRSRCSVPFHRTALTWGPPSQACRRPPDPLPYPGAGSHWNAWWLWDKAGKHIWLHKRCFNETHSYSPLSSYTHLWLVQCQSVS